MNSTIKVSAVQYLNAKPIVYGLENNLVSHRFELNYDIPSACSAKLNDQEVDLALIPSIEYSRIRGRRLLSIVPDIAIASRQEVKSVELFFNRNLSTISKIAVDTGSRTSVALLQIVLREKYDIEAEFMPMPPDMDAMLKQADAALIIGDTALEHFDSMDNHLDLGEEWLDLTDGLPFVFAFWAGAPDALTCDDVRALSRSRDAGLENLSEIAKRHADSKNGNAQSYEFYVNYLRDNIQFHLGKEELEGLKEYYSYCYYYGLIDEIPELQFFNDTQQVTL
jgi:chorismate dehydratase